MKKLRMVIDLEYDDDLCHGGDEWFQDWWEEIQSLQDEERLILHSNLIGDEIGSVKIVDIVKGWVHKKRKQHGCEFCSHLAHCVCE